MRPIKGALANSVDPDQTLHNAASAQDPYCLQKIKEFLQNTVIMKTNQTPPFTGNELVRRVKVEEFIRHKWVDTVMEKVLRLDVELKSSNQWYEEC